MKDSFGETIYVNDIITYPVRRGAFMGMVDAIVLDTTKELVVMPIQYRTPEGGTYLRTGRTVVLKRLHTVTIITHVMALHAETPSGFKLTCSYLDDWNPQDETSE